MDQQPVGHRLARRLHHLDGVHAGEPSAEAGDDGIAAVLFDRAAGQQRPQPYGVGDRGGQLGAVPAGHGRGDRRGLGILVHDALLSRRPASAPRWPARCAGQLGGVGRRPVDQARLTAAQERHADQVQARAGRHAAVVDDPAPAVEHRDVEPGQVGPVAGRPDDRADRPGPEVQGQRRGAHERRREPLTGCPGPGVDRVQQPPQLQVGQRAHVGQGAGELGDPAGDPGQPASQPHPGRGQRVQVHGPARRADQLHRRHVSRPYQITGLVVALVQHPCGVQPPQDVPAAVGARHPDVLADGERDRAPRAGQLVGKLDPAGRGADHQHPAPGQPARVPVTRWSDRGDSGRHQPRQRRHRRQRRRPAGQHHRRRAPGPLAGPHHVSASGCPHRGHRHPGQDRRS